MTPTAEQDGIGSIVIVGGGVAGVQAASSLRAEGYRGRLHLLCGETIPPYHRPPLSKGFLASAAPEPAMLRSADFYRQNDIDILLGNVVEAIDRRAARVILSSGGELAYDRLVLATGVESRGIHPSGSRRRFHAIRSAADAVRFRTALRDASRIGIVGGGFVGLEVCASLRLMGKAVTVFEAQDRLMKRSLSPEVSTYLLSRHSSMGADVRLAASLEGLQGHEDRVTVSVNGAPTESYDAVLIAVGAVPNERLAAQSGLRVSDGIVVDANMRTSDPAIFAIGDCARFPSWHLGRPCRLESIQNATGQARHAARVICGKADTPYDATPWFWSDQYDIKLQIAGLGTEITDRVVRHAGEHAFSVFSFDHERLVAVESVNRPSDHILGRKIIDGSEIFTPEMAADTGLAVSTA